MQYSFDVEIANKYGVDEAIIYNNIVFWTKKNEANKQNYFRNKYWMYNTLEAWDELFTFWSKDKIFRTLKKMVEKGMILKGFHGKNKFDRTAYYTSNMHIAELQNAYCGIAKSDIAELQNVHIAELQNDYKGAVKEAVIKPVINNIAPEFELFWKGMKKRGNKKTALDKYIKLRKSNKLPPIENILEILDAWDKSGSWDNLTFIPHATRWLKEERWLDELPQVKPTSTIRQDFIPI